MSDGMKLGRVPTGISGLDTILHGGFLTGGLYIVQGTPGTGKTTLANQISFHHAATGGRVLYVTLLAEYHARMMQHLGGMAFFDSSKIPDEISYISGFGALRESGYPGLRDLLRREIARHKATILVLDGFANMQRGSPGANELNEFAHELQGIANATECTMFLLSSAARVTETPEYTIVDGIVELSDQLFGWSSESALQVVKLRGSPFLRGRHAFRITDQGIMIYPRIEALFARPTQMDRGGIEKVSSGLDRLDTMLGGGLPVASTTMVMGPSGVGKTTLGLQFLSQCNEAEPGLLFGFYETPRRIGAKVDEVCEPLRSLLDNGVVEVLWQPPTDRLLDAYADRLLEAVHRRGVRRLVIDGLGGFQAAAVEPSRMNHFLTALMNELRVLGVTTLYTLEIPGVIGPSLGDLQAPIGDLSGLAENLVLMRYMEVHAHLHRLISVLKVRDSAFDATLYEYVTSGQGLQIAATSESAQAIMSGAPRKVGATSRVQGSPPKRGG